MWNARGVRIIATVLAVGCVLGSLIGAGLMVDDADADRGDVVELSGEVVTTDPIQIETGAQVLTVENVETHVDRPVRSGDILTVSGEVREDQVLDAEAGVVRAPWEFQYMYAVSVLGGLWVLVRLLRHWRVDTATLAIEPRSGEP